MRVVNACSELDDVAEAKLDDVLNHLSDLSFMEVPVVPFALTSTVLREQGLSGPDVHGLEAFVVALRLELGLLDLIDGLLNRFDLFNQPSTVCCLIVIELLSIDPVQGEDVPELDRQL